MERAKGMTHFISAKVQYFLIKPITFPQKIMDIQDFGVIINYLQIFFINKWHKGNHRITPNSRRAIKML